jgi:hypothetical protein
VFRVTHPFHPLHGRQFSLVTVRNNWGEDRVYYHDTDERLVSIPAAWTDVCTPDPFVHFSGGRSPFCLEDLLELARLLSVLKEEASHGD